METDTLSKWYQKKAGTATLTSDKINFKNGKKRTKKNIM